MDSHLLISAMCKMTEVRPRKRYSSKRFLQILMPQVRWKELSQLITCQLRVTNLPYLALKLLVTVSRIIP